MVAFQFLAYVWILLLMYCPLGFLDLTRNDDAKRAFCNKTQNNEIQKELKRYA